MPERRQNGISWTVLFAGAAVAVSFISGLWSVVNPKGDLSDLKKDFVDLQWRLKQDYVPKELAVQELKHINDALIDLKDNKVGKDVYEQKINDVQNRQNIQRTRLEAIDQSVNLTYSTKDALQQMQAQILELQRILHAQKP
jgi:hypothetical protein